MQFQSTRQFHSGLLVVAVLALAPWNSPKPGRILIVGGEKRAVFLSVTGPVTLLTALKSGGFWPPIGDDADERLDALKEVEIRQTEADENRTFEVLDRLPKSSDPGKVASLVTIFPGATIYVQEPRVPALLVVPFPGGVPFFTTPSRLSARVDPGELRHHGRLLGNLLDRPDQARLEPVKDLKNGDVLVLSPSRRFDLGKNVGSAQSGPTQGVASDIVVMGDTGSVYRQGYDETLSFSGYLQQASDAMLGHIRTTANGGAGYYWDGPGHAKPGSVTNPSNVDHSVKPGDTIVVCSPRPIYAVLWSSGAQVWPVGESLPQRRPGQTASVLHHLLGCRPVMGKAHLVSTQDFGPTPIGDDYEPEPGDLIIYTQRPKPARGLTSGDVRRH